MSIQKQIDQLRAQRAAEWLELMTSGDATLADNQAFISWVCESPRHMEEVVELIGISHEVHSALHEKPLDRDELLRKLTSNVTAFPLEQPKPATEAKSASRRYWWQGLVAASVLLAVAAVLANLGYLGGKRYATAVGEQRAVDLVDGSVVYLNGKSAIVVRFAGDARNVDLEGEALFRVAHDVQRPFRVHTRDAIVRAVGTQFNVDTHLGGTSVAVLEGVVQVTTDATQALSAAAVLNAGRESPTKLEAGEAAHVSRAGAIEKRPTTEAASAAAWRQRQLVFEGMALEEAVEEFNRYRKSMQLRVEGVPPGSHHYSGTFDADDPESFADLLAREHDLSVEKRANAIIIRAR